MNFKIVLTIIIVSSALGLIVNFISPKGIPLIAEGRSLSWANEEINVDANGEDVNFKEPPAIHLKQAKNLYDHNALFIDAREKEEYDLSHIKGAINIPFYSFDEYKNQLKNVEKGRAIVTYCGGTDCDLSILLGNQLFELGYKNTFIFFGGWNEWLEGKYPITQK